MIHVRPRLVRYARLAFATIALAAVGMAAPGDEPAGPSSPAGAPLPGVVANPADPAAELQTVLAKLREARAAGYERQRARAAELERVRRPLRQLEGEIAELKAREADTDKELAAVREELAGLRREEVASDAAKAVAAPELDRAVARAAAFVAGGIPYRVEDRAQRLAGAADCTRPQADRFARYWAHLQEELRIARSGEAYTADVPLGAARVKPARLFRVGHLALGYLTEDGRESGLFLNGGWTPSRTTEAAERIRAAIEMLDRRRGPALLPLPFAVEGVR
ncbi:MAG: DUF3450 family protein [Planctomycetes bacterium]|nr:DUF3450 family protein [Planctomycetota bacterium]